VFGITGARTENFTIEGASFYNFEHKKSAALGSCSHCEHPDATSSGAFTFKTSGLVFEESTVPRRITWHIPFREIIHDVDGTLTGLGPDSFATFYYPHLDQPECTHDADVFDGIVCSPEVQIRRVAYY